MRCGCSKSHDSRVAAANFIIGLGVFYRAFPKAKVWFIDCVKFADFSIGFCCLQNWEHWLLRPVLILE